MAVVPLFLANRLTGARELMEDPGCDLARLNRTFAQFRAINSLVSGWRHIYRRYLRPAAAVAGTKLLDIGFVSGDIPIRLAEWARRDGLDLRITAVDTDPRALAYVAGLEVPESVTFRGEAPAALLARGERFDLVISNHLIHHFEEPTLAEFCDVTRRLARRLVIHNAIVRGDFAYLGFFALTAPLFRRSFIVRDGLTSIRRSFSHRELRRLAPEGWRAVRTFPFHHLLVWEALRAEGHPLLVEPLLKPARLATSPRT